MNRGTAVVLLICSPLLAGLAMYAVGVFLPREHTAVVVATLTVPPAPVLKSVIDIQAYPDWRRDVESVVRGDEPGSWTESGPGGTMGYQRLTQSATHVETEILDPSGEFGGTWTFTVAPAPTGTTLTVTENGWIQPPVFRTISAVFLDPHAMMEDYVTDLAKHLDADVTIERK